MTALQKIIKTAKGLQKKNKSLAWKDAIKKAGIIYRKEKKPVKSVKAKKAIGKKPAVKKAVKKKAILKPGKHTDTKSHNVNIRVVSGVNNMYKVRNLIERQLQSLVKTYETNKPGKTQTEKRFLRSVKKSIVVTKKQLREQNTLISQNLK